MKMQPFIRVTGAAAALRMANVDTDVIMPKQFLKGIAGLDAGALYDLRFDGSGLVRPDFVLNRPAWRDARFLIVGPNFGCGSSREHAVWGLMQLGIRAVLGTTFGGIFADNAANNGLLLVSLGEDEISTLSERADDPSRNQVTVDLSAETVSGIDLSIRFSIDPLSRNSLMRGLDAIGSTLEHAGEIRRFQEIYLDTRPWLA
jgi:3-isopropylmalate/(R)-2-methylmalate dehydratase small subunit